MSDVDDELLALAGGDVSSDEDEAMDMSRDDSRSPSPPPASSSKSAANKSASARKSKSRARSQDESEDEGEASPPASPSSQMSAPMDESDSDSDAPQPRNDDEPLYPVEGLFKSLEEKEQIMSLREIEREQILAERREENERIRQNRMLRLLKVNQEKDSKKRKASIADLDDASSSRKPARARTKAGESSDKMDTLRRAREERSNRKEQRERERQREKDRRRRDRDSSYSRSRSRSRGGSPRSSDDDDWHRDSRRRSRSPDRRDAPPAELRDVERIRLGRSRFAEVWLYPGFEKAITGCYVRINIGPDPNTRQDVYRMAVIKGFTQGKAYALTDARGHQQVVDLYVKAAHGKAVRDWPFITCSDRPFTEAEWNRYKQVCLSEGLPVPSKPDLVDKIADINALIHRQWTDQEVSEKLRRQNALLAKYTQRETVAKQLELARQRGDEEQAAKLQEKLDSLDVPRLAFRTQLKLGPSATSTTSPKKPSAGAASSGGAGGGSGSTLSQQEKLALLNLENRRKNAETVRKAHLMERARAREQARAAAAAAAANGNKNGSQNGSRSGTPAAAEKGEGEAALLPHIAKLQELQRSKEEKKGLPVIHKPLMDDEVIGALDLEIDVEIE